MATITKELDIEIEVSDVKEWVEWASDEEVKEVFDKIGMFNISSVEDQIKLELLIDCFDSLSMEDIISLKEGTIKC